MGIDLYGCYTPSKDVMVKMPDGSQVEACLCRYIARPYRDNWGHDINNRLMRLPDDMGYVHRATGLKVLRIQKMWEGRKRPRYSIHVSPSDILQQRGLKQPVVGNMFYASSNTPVLWLEEVYGDVGMGCVKRIRNGLWTFEGFGTGYQLSDDPITRAEQVKGFRAQYEEAVAKVLREQERRANVKLQEATI